VSKVTMPLPLVSTAEPAPSLEAATTSDI
jgi:hypothetical protein